MMPMQGLPPEMEAPPQSQDAGGIGPLLMALLAMIMGGGGEQPAPQPPPGLMPLGDPTAPSPNFQELARQRVGM